MSKLNPQNLRKNIKNIRVLRIAMVVVLLTSMSFSGVTLAKYSEAGSGNSGTARVAKWNVDMTKVDAGEGFFSVDSIGPEASGSQTINFDNTGQVSGNTEVLYKNKFSDCELTYTGGDNTTLDAVLQDCITATYTVYNADDDEVDSNDEAPCSLAELPDALNGVKVPMNGSIVLYWDWADETEESQEIANAYASANSTGVSITMTMKYNAEQVD
ncbi:MAG: hypothetical protein LBT37_08225 [Lactobacillaceae bacterium]|nr:hypothetical protein [Lactobacillaceae bacterium]